VINGKDQSPGKSIKAKKSVFTAYNKTARFSTEIANAYPKDAQVNSWVGRYTLNRGKKNFISDKFQMSGLGEIPTSLNLITWCKVSELKPGLLKFEGDGFKLNMSHNPKIVKPGIEYIEVKDNSLKRYKPEGITRVVPEYINPGLKGGEQVTFSPAK